MIATGPGQHEVVERAEGVVRLETATAAFVGWSKIPTFDKAPDVLFWKNRVFKFRGYFEGAVDNPEPFLLYREAFACTLLGVCSERPKP